VYDSDELWRQDCITDINTDGDLNPLEAPARAQEVKQWFIEMGERDFRDPEEPPIATYSFPALIVHLVYWEKVISLWCDSVEYGIVPHWAVLNFHSDVEVDGVRELAGMIKQLLCALYNRALADIIESSRALKDRVEQDLERAETNLLHCSPSSSTPQQYHGALDDWEILRGQQRVLSNIFYYAGEWLEEGWPDWESEILISRSYPPSETLVNDVRRNERF